MSGLISPGPEGYAFPKTQWDLVRSSPEDQALNRLISLYWKPIYFFIRRRGYDRETAQDLVQEYWLHFLEHHLAGRADPARGRFRSFLLSVLTNFLKDYRKAQSRCKRGGGRFILSLDFAQGEVEYARHHGDGEAPEVAYHRAWTRSLIQQTLEHLKGDPAHLEAFRLHLTGMKFAEVAKETGLTVAAARSAAQRVRGQFKTALVREILPTVSSRAKVDEELAYFLTYLP